MLGNTVKTHNRPPSDRVNFNKAQHKIYIQTVSFEFEIEYLTHSYRETANKMAFDMATLWSQIGGFIGMFLGYSLLQVPELAETWYKQMFRTLFK